jgi:hypothetical protein
MPNNRNIYLVTFGTKGGQSDFSLSRYRLENEARYTGWFSDVFNYTAEDLSSYNRSFTGTGAGWWWWKSVVCQISLNKIKKDDIILFLDAGCSINIKGEKRFWEYIELCDSGPGFVGFGGGGYWSEIGGGGVIEKIHTKRDLLLHLGCDSPKYTETTQLGSGLFFVKNNKFGKDLINQFVELSKNEHFLNDSTSSNQEYNEFIAHRHDQSILSLLVKLRLSELNNYLFNLREVSGNIKDDLDFQYPLKATRINDSHLWNNMFS